MQPQKIWRVLPPIRENFRKKYPEYSRVVLQLLWNRGVINDNLGAAAAREAIDEFLYPDYEKNIYDPFLFKNMAAAAELIIKHIKRGNKICVYGDYDADGVTASAVLHETLSVLRGRVEIYIPDRISEGYGLNKKAVKEIAEKGNKLIITVDTGIRNREEVEYARESGLDIIVTDHHVPSVNAAELPACLVVDAFMPEEKYPFRDLAGVGVAFKMAAAVISRTKLSGTDKKKLETRLLDLVAIGTVADCVSLLGENRVLVKRGLEVLNGTKRPGLSKLIKNISLNNGGILRAWNIGWQIAPRLNAAGRMDHANTAFELLTTRVAEEAEAITKRLNDRNVERQKITEEITKKVEEQIKEGDKIIIGVCPTKDGAGTLSLADIDRAAEDRDETWNEGVIGLAAGRIADKYYLPTLVITRSEDGLKGSGRSVAELNIISIIEEVGDLLEKYGGHAGACGFSLKPEKLVEFKHRVSEAVRRRLKGVDLAPKMKIEAELNLKEISESMIKQIEKFEPFGQGNERPKFVSRGVAIVDKIVMGLDGRHLKLMLKQRQSGILPAVGFGQAERWRNLRIGDIIDIVYNVEINEFNGRKEAQLKIVDINSHNR